MRQFLLPSFVSLLLLLETFCYTDGDETDKQALLGFKSQVSVDKRALLSSWNQSFPLCNWTGVTCGRKHKRVTRLDLGGLRLGGVISPSIGNLSFLISLNLSDNSFGGTIPQEVGNLFRLKYLFMSFNFLRGGVPISLFNCVPSGVGSLTKLRTLDLGKNNLEGKLPASLGNLTLLMQVSVTNNNMEGEVPDDIARLAQMVAIDLSLNNFSGFFPPSIYNWSSIEFLNIFGNGFSGSLRNDFGNLLPKLREVYMGTNYLTGAIPATLPNISNLQGLRMEYNNLRGSISPSFGKVEKLQILALQSNGFGSYSFGDLDFIGALNNCTKLQRLYAGQNRLGGDLPTSVTNLSTKLITLDLGTNLISGTIPRDIGNLISLQTLWLQENLLTGPLPTSLGRVSELGELIVFSNRMLGEIPSSIGNLTQLQRLLLYNNSFQGIIPPSLGNCRYLGQLLIGSNKLNGSIPNEIMKIQPLVRLNMSGNSLIGTLSEDIGKLQNLVTLSLGNNKLSGHLPQALGKYIKGLVGVKKVDFSNNNFSGSIPEYFSNFSSLEYLNLSANNLEGRVPEEGKFQNSTIVSVFGNKNLCGGIEELKLKPCLEQVPVVDTKHSSHLKKVAVGLSKKQQSNNQTPSTLGAFHENMSYGDLRNAKNGFSSSNIVGSGSFGTVFKAFLPTENKVVAVKVLNLQRRGAMKSFMSECESLKNIRHRNLVKLLTSCAGIDFQGNEFRALIYDFMSNGTLDMWLHPEEVEKICSPLRALTLLEGLTLP
ncbi:hypothetical protein CARUB_v10016726mg [Capsella rubella]|uniref:non-specific serine/threonine protein kinase n=1 Tax=Capsella rubella TaxID=81985 RepID=R0HI89_9BRAS|nr:hypothetical protein CARUB_v10016726mg [Capsella rubella]